MTKFSIGNQNTNNPSFEWKSKRTNPDWINPAIAGGWFIGLFLILGMFATTQITEIELVKWYLIFASIITILPYRLILKVIFIDYSHWVVANVIGIGPFVTGLFLLINFMFTTNPTNTTYLIQEVPRPEPIATGPTTIILENDTLMDYPRFRTFNFHEVVFSKSVTYNFSEGLFGYPILEESIINK